MVLIVMRILRPLLLLLRLKVLIAPLLCHQGSAQAQRQGDQDHAKWGWLQPWRHEG